MLETTDQVQLLETCALYLIVYPPKRLTHVELFWVLFYLLLFITSYLSPFSLWMSASPDDFYYRTVRLQTLVLVQGQTFFFFIKNVFMYFVVVFVSFVYSKGTE